MDAPTIRARFLDYFRRQSHAVRPSASLVPADDPTLLFTNAGMVQFKRVFLGREQTSFGLRAATAQKCVRAGGKHNDLEQVGYTARHHTFFEMLGNFSFGDYFKRDAIRFAWEFVTRDLAIPRDFIRVTVFESDDEARALWKEVAGLPETRIYGLGEKDNFWQMADTGPCGPCTEIYVDLARIARDYKPPDSARGEWTDLDRHEFSRDSFEEGAEAGRFLEIWNLVFMQFDRQADGTLVPLPKPSVDTGAGLERIAAVMQGVTNNFHTDVFRPMLEAVERTTGIEYRGRESMAPHAGPSGATVDPGAFHVLADHARSVAFLLADGVLPSNEGRGYVLRRILRRAVRYAWLLGRVEPTLVHVVTAVIESMGEAYPELRTRRNHILETTRLEEERFLATIQGGMARFDQLAPHHTTGTRLIAGDDAFRLYDTYGFPIDLTELMARERGYAVDIPGFEQALEAQRNQSQLERRSKKIGVGADDLGLLSAWTLADGIRDRLPESTFVGYDHTETAARVVASRLVGDGRAAVILDASPFYAESGGQVSDHGEVVGEGWRLDVDEVRKVDGRAVALGKLTRGEEPRLGPVIARLPAAARRDTERNHTATHLLHAALRSVLGDHVHQAGSLVAPERLRFDFTHHGPVGAEQLSDVESLVNRWIWSAVEVTVEEKPYKEALATGAMALFGEKYGDVVRVVSVPGFSRELCGGTHVRNTSQIGLCRLLGEGGVAAGVRRIEALTGARAFEWMRERERILGRIAASLRSTPDVVERKVAALAEDHRLLERKVADSTRQGGGDEVQRLIAGATSVRGVRVVAAPVDTADLKSLQTLGDALRQQLGSGAGVLASSTSDGKHTLLAVVTDDLRDRGLHADAMIKELASVVGGRGGGKAHMAQAGIPDGARIPEALAMAVGVVDRMLGAAA
ncbi:MAG: alanine--tRNA ligase [Gemmatimonadaceae bacterium]